MDSKSNQVILFVEQLNPDQTLGYTTNHLMMLENANRIRIKDIGDISDINGLIFQAGRYVASLMTDINGVLSMFFVDLKKDRHKALAVSSQYNGEAKEIFMKHFEAVTHDYDKNYNLVKLLVSNEFPSNVVANQIGKIYDSQAKIELLLLKELKK